MQISICKKTDVDHSALPPVEFGDIVTCDQGVLTDWSKARAGQVDQLVLVDRGTRWKFPHATESRMHEEVILGFRGFLGSSLPTPKLVYSDNGSELLKAYKVLGFPNDRSQSHRPATNGFAE